MESDPGTEPSGAPLCLTFRSGTVVTEETDGTLRVEHLAGTFVLRRVPGDVRRFLLRMATGSVPPDVPVSADGAGRAALSPSLAVVIGRLERLVEYRVRDASGEDALAVETMVRESRHRPLPPSPDVPLRLSRFAYLRRDTDGLVLESPLCTRRVRVLTPRAAGLVWALGTATTVTGLAGGLGLAEAEVSRLTGHLTGAGLVEQAADGVFPEDTAAARQWSFPDMLFHSRSRMGHHDYPIGAAFPFAEEIPPAPAVGPARPGPSIALPRPDLTSVLAADPPLTTVLEGRRSIRAAGREPITLRQLGEFLYRSARIRSLTDQDARQGTRYAVTSRPYPSGGAGYELEFYLTVRRCPGAEPGVYHYDPLSHRLVLVNDDPADRARLLQGAVRAVGAGPPPDVLITLTSRFQRLSWKYLGMAYATTLKHVGVVQQTMYVVATAMNLAPCALGNGDSAQAERILGLDRLQESPVGEFALSAAPPPSEAPAGPSAWRPVNDHEWHTLSVERLTGR
ncbi:SagB family peptide dehydrogenase [Streptomyces sp. LP11]|uniref:SagB family peptide dehydrogenase n=1 Tax=Streptomyces pyxinicus TaxID=2970331 RepID=A0ABT2B6W6_9ACTN|nr:SagB family peptide dehydrogenase [Streptomyces sp. LP11]MCS0604145.1 SagB family peptide dehydrogenase [Streptomyces sp. LP11]